MLMKQFHMLAHKKQLEGGIEPQSQNDSTSRYNSSPIYTQIHINTT
jgi:hypothetical protein